MSAAESLDLFDDATPDELGDNWRDQWRVTDDDEAGKVLRRIRWRERQIADHAANAQAERERIDRWEAQVCGPLLDRCVRDRQLLEDYLRQLVAVDPRKKSHKLPDGELKRRAGSQSVVIDDEPAFVAAALTGGFEDLVRVTRTPDKAALKASVKSGVLQCQEDGTVYDAAGAGFPLPARIVTGPESYVVAVDRGDL